MNAGQYLSDDQRNLRKAFGMAVATYTMLIVVSALTFGLSILVA